MRFFSGSISRGKITTSAFLHKQLNVDRVRFAVLAFHLAHDPQRLIEDLERILPLPKIVVDPAHIGETSIFRS
jgi:hypothetical protein